MFVSRLLLPATFVLAPWLTACSWAQSYSPMQQAYRGAVPATRPQFSLSNQATRPPAFPDQQGNQYTAMSPDSWGHPATRSNQPRAGYAAPYQAKPQYANPQFANPQYTESRAATTSPVLVQQLYSPEQIIERAEQLVSPNQLQQGISPSQEMVLTQPIGQPELDEQSILATPEQEPAFTPLTNTGDRSTESALSNTADSDSPSLQTKSDGDQRAKTPGPRYAQAQDFPFEGPDLSSIENSDDVPFPFTRKKSAEPVAPSDVPNEQPLLGSQGAVDFADDTILPTSPAQDLQSPVTLDTRDVSIFSTDSELGLYAKPRNASPVVQSPVMQSPEFQPSNFQPNNAGSQHYLSQQSVGQQSQTLNQNQFDYPNQVAPPTGQWQHPNGGASFQQGPTISQPGARQQVPNWASMVQTQQSAPHAQTGQPGQQALPQFRPDLGHRDVMPTVRNNPVQDDGKKFDHEKKKVDYPPFKEIIATGKFFYNAEVNALRPSFLGNTGLSIDGAEFSESRPFEFATTYAPHVKFGFESQYGPGIELSYFNLTENANTLGATSDGSGSVASIASVTGPGRFSSISADGAGETLTADHSFELETIGVNFFKELKFPISRLNGKFGFMYANIAQSLLVDVTDADGASIGELTNTTDFRGYGPQFALEYFRPVGHTPLTLVTSFGGKGLFGRRDQFVSNDAGAVERRFGADEFVTVIDFAGGVQLKKLVADGRYWTAKVGYLHQSWLGGGTAVDPQGDFGISGFTFGIGYNR